MHGGAKRRATHVPIDGQQGLGLRRRRRAAGHERRDRRERRRPLEQVRRRRELVRMREHEARVLAPLEWLWRECLQVAQEEQAIWGEVGREELRRAREARLERLAPFAPRSRPHLLRQPLDALQHAGDRADALHGECVDELLAERVKAALGRDDEHEHVARLVRVEHRADRARRLQQREAVPLHGERRRAARRGRVRAELLRDGGRVGESARGDERHHLGRARLARSRTVPFELRRSLVLPHLIGLVPPRGFARLPQRRRTRGVLRRALHALVLASAALARTALGHGWTEATST